MEVPSAVKLSEMGLLEKKNSITTETVFLRNTTRRTELYISFSEHNQRDENVAECKLNNNSAAVIKKLNTDKGIPVEPIKRVNLNGIPNDELFGPAFLYEETEFYTGKKVISANPVKMNLEPNYSSDEEIQCTFVG